MDRFRQLQVRGSITYVKCYYKEDLEHQIAAFIEHDTHHRIHESLDNLKPADAYFFKGSTISLERNRIKQEILRQRRLIYRVKAA